MSSENGRDPFRGFLGLVRDEAAGQIKSAFVVGRVLEASATSIRIQADGHELDEQDILINAALAGLKAGDLVLLMPDESRQLYFLICKVVRYGTVSAD